jgi:predicted enzyme related to lactoylglutathione lyase
MAITVLFAGVASADYDSALTWYERLLGRPPDLIPHETEAAWQLAEAGWIYLVADPDRAGKALLTLIVDDLDEQIASLAERGLVTGAVETLTTGGRKATITDPEGNMITFAQP